MLMNPRGKPAQNHTCELEPTFANVELGEKQSEKKLLQQGNGGSKSFLKLS
jgi:hypothetical protein